MVVIKVSALTNHPSISLQNQVGTQLLKQQKVELPKDSALRVQWVICLWQTVKKESEVWEFGHVLVKGNLRL